MARRTIALIFALLILSSCSRSKEEYVRRGNELFQNQKFEDASIQYKRAVQKDSSFGEAYYRLGLSEIKRRNFLDAYQAMLKAAQLSPSNLDAKIKLGDICLAIYIAEPKSRGYYDQAAKVANELLSKDPSSVDGLRILGWLALRDKRTAEAVEYLEKANRLKPNYSDVVVGLAQALFAEKKSTEAENLLVAFLGKDSSIEPAFDLLYTYYRSQNRIDDATRIWEQKAAAHPKEGKYVIALAEHYEQIGRSEESAKALQRIASNPAQYEKSYALLGDFFARRRKWDDALNRYNQGLQSDSSHKLEYQKRIASVYRAQRKNSDALRLADTILKEDPKDTEARILRANILAESRKKEDLDQAATLLKDLTQSQPFNAELPHTLGRVYWTQGNLDAALNSIQESLRRDPTFIEARTSLVGLQLNRKRPQDAVVAASDLIRLEGKNPVHRLLYGIALGESGSLAEARKQLSLLVKEFPGFREAWLQLGIVAIGQKQYKEAEEIFNRMRGLGDADARASTGLVNAYFAQNRFDSAIDSLSAEVRKSPDSLPLRSLLASTAARAGKYDLAISEFQNLAAKNPKSADPKFRLGLVYAMKGDPAKALEAMDQALQLDPRNPQMLGDSGAMLLQVGKPAEARDRYRALLAVQPDNPMAQNALAFSLAEAGTDLDEAMRLINQAMTKLPDSESMQDTLGWIYLKKNRPDSAIQIFRALNRKYPENPTYQFHLGAALHKQGDRSAAKAALDAALQLKPAPAEEKEIRQLLAKVS